ncbi:MAG: PKD domain-containing protein, partial [Thermotogota bacterium]
GGQSSDSAPVSVQTLAAPDLTVTALAYAPTNPTLGQQVSFTVTVANQGSAATGQFRVLLDGGLSSSSTYVTQLAAGAAKSLTFSLQLGSGTQTFTARADDLGQIAESNESNNTRAVTISAVTSPPTAEAGGPYAGNAGAPIVFNGSASGGSITTYSWSFGDGAAAQGVAPSHAYAAPGTYTATLTVVGPGGQSSDSAPVSVTTITPPPIAEAGGPYTGTVGVPIALNGSASSGSITTYSWSFGDGATTQGAAPSHTYGAPGTYTATLTVAGPGGQSSDSSTVSVVAAQPALAASVAVSKSTYQVGELISVSIATIRAAYLYLCEVRADQRVLLIYPNRYQPNNFQGAGTLTLPGPGYSLRAVEPVGNETFYLFAAAAPIPGFPTSFGSDFPVLSASPDAFRNNVLATMQSLVPSADRAFASQAFSVVAAPSSGGTLRVVTTPTGAAVRLDGSSLGAAPVERTNVAVGLHTVQLSLSGYEVETRQVSIQAGATTTLTVTLTPLPTNQPPTASFSFAPVSPLPGQSVTFDASASSDPDGSIASYAWDFGDGTSATEVSPSHAYAAPGSFAVVLTVTDNGGLSRSTSRSVPVTENPAWVSPALPAAPSEGWADQARAVDGDPKVGARGPGTRSDWTPYITFSAPSAGFVCDGVRFRTTFILPSIVSIHGGRGKEPDPIKLTWQVDILTATGWKQVYEGATSQNEWIDLSFVQEAVTEVRFRARGDIRNTLDPILLELYLHDASL